MIDDGIDLHLPPWQPPREGQGVKVIVTSAIACLPLQNGFPGGAKRSDGRVWPSCDASPLHS
jgi:hypothetical protein